MAQYTIEDIEILRQKSGISYEEAVNLLEYHNGSLARSLVDLEKNGRLRDEKPRPYGKSDRKRHHGLFNTLYRIRVKVFKNDTPIVNLSMIFMIFALLIAPWLVVLSAVAVLLMGYRFAVERDSLELGNETLEEMMKNAGNNMKTAAYTIARDLGMNDDKKAETEKQPETPAEPEQRTETPASGTTPVSVQFSEDGDVRVTEDSDGYHEADIQ
jgi:hypothetical protein